MSLGDPKAEEHELDRLGQNDSEVIHAIYKLHKCRIFRSLMLTLLCLTAISPLKKLPLEEMRPKILTAQR